MQSYAMQTVIAGTRRVLISFLEKTLQNDTIADSGSSWNFPAVVLLLFLVLLLCYSPTNYSSVMVELNHKVFHYFFTIISLFSFRIPQDKNLTKQGATQRVS